MCPACLDLCMTCRHWKPLIQTNQNMAYHWKQIEIRILVKTLQSVFADSHACLLPTPSMYSTVSSYTAIFTSL